MRVVMDFEQRIFQFIKKNKLIAPRGLVVIGASGGADSMALLLTLDRLRHDLGAGKAERSSIFLRMMPGR